MNKIIRLLSHYTPLRFFLLPIFRVTIGIVFSQSVTPDRFYEINPEIDYIPSFDMWLDIRSTVQLQKIKGTYEKEILRTVSSSLKEDEVFWEVGAGWGYFSLAMAHRASKVVAFEEAENRIRAIKRSAKRNEFRNIKVIEGTVGKDVELADYTPPDVVLMDIEGWEYQVLSSTIARFDREPTWIVEVHDPTYLPDIPKHANPGGVYELFERHGYSVTKLNSRRKGNHHILATPENNPDNIPY